MGQQVLISFDIDESKVQENAEKEAARQIVKEMIGNGNTYYGAASIRIREYIKDILAGMIEPEKDEIIEKAVKEVVENLHRTKAVKDMLKSAT